MMLVYMCMLLLTITIHCADEETIPQIFSHNNPFNISDNNVFWPHFGKVYDLYKSEYEVRNIVVPLSGYTKTFQIIPGTHAPVYFNLLEHGKNLGQYVLSNKTLYKINDGRDSTADYPPENGEGEFDKNVYIGAADGIYVYDPETRIVKKYGNVTDDILAIDKVTEKDEIYILTTDHKIYKITDHGTVKTLVEGVDYAKDFVLDFLEALYFLGEDNKPQVLLKGQTVPFKFVEFDFDVINPILCRPMQTFGLGNPRTEYSIPFMVDGVPYQLINANQTTPLENMNRVSGLTAFSAEHVYYSYFAVDGKIYVDNILE